MATHPHADHIGGMSDVFEQLKIKSVYMPNAVTDTKTFDRLLNAIENEHCDVTEAKAGMSIFSDGNLKADILAPVSESYDDLNNYSVVIKVTYGEMDYLFTGDSEAEVEKQLLAKDISAEVLKAGHHGSSTSSTMEFVRRVNPDYAIISCGKDNDYGHPHIETVATFDELGVQMLRTDELGSIIISSDGENLEVEGFEETNIKNDINKNNTEKYVSYATVILVILITLMKKKKRKRR